MNAYYKLLHREINQGISVAHYRCHIHAQGVWNEHEQHMAPATGILCAELEQFLPNPNMRIGRISLDIFGLIQLDDFSITTQVIRAGRTIELIEATMHTNEKICIVARAWRMQTSDTHLVSGLEDDHVEHPENLPRWYGMQHWGGGFIRSIETHVEPSHRAGKGLVWINTDIEMIEGQQTSDFVHLMGLVDTANGIAPRITQNKIEWIFPNLDLQIHLHRLPVGRWLGINAVQQIGQDGIGLTSSVLHDIHGPFGRSEQILTVRKLK